MSEEIILKALSAGGSGGGSGSIPFADEDGSTVASTPGRGQSRIFSKEELIYSDVTPRGETTSRNVANFTSFRNPILKSNTESNVAVKYRTSSKEVGIDSKQVSGTRIGLKKSRTDSCVPEADNPLQRYENALLKYQKIKVPAKKQISRENSYGYSSSDDSVIRNKSKSTSSIDTQSVNNILDEYEDLDYRRSSDLSDVGSINVTNFEAVMDQQRQREKSKLRSPMAPAARNAGPPLSEKLQPLLKVNQQTQVRQRSRDRLKDSGRNVPVEETSGATAGSAGKTSVETESNKNFVGKVPDLLMRKGEVQKRVDEWLSQTQSQNFVGVKDKVLVRSNSSADYRYRNNSNSRARSVEETGEKLNGTVSYDDLNREGNKGEVKADKVSIGVNTSRGTYKEYLATRSKMKQNDYGFSGSNGTRSTRDMSPGTASKIPQRGFSNSSFRSKKTELGAEPADSSKITCSFESRVTRERSKITENRLASQTKSRADPEPGKATSTIIPSRRPSFKRTQSVNQSAGVLIKEERSPRARPTVSSEKGPSSGGEREARLTGQLAALPNMDGESQRPLLPCEAQVSDADRTDPGKPMEGSYRDERNLKKLTTDSVEPERAAKERVAVRTSCKVQPKIETSSRLDSIYGPVEPPRLRALHGQVESSNNKELENQSQLSPMPRTFHAPNAFEGRKLPAIPRKDQSQTGNENYVKCTIINPVSTFKPNNAMYATLQQPSEQNSFATTTVNESVTRSHYATPKHIEKIYERPQPQVIHADDLESILKPVALPSAYGDKLLANERKVHVANDVGNSRGQNDDDDIYEKISDVRFEQLETIVEDQKSDNDECRFPEIGLSQCLKVQQKMTNGKAKSSGLTESTGKDTIYAKPWDQTVILNDPPKTFSTFQTHHQDSATRLNHVNQSRRTCPAETNEPEGLSGKVREQNSEPSEDMQESYDGNSLYEVRSTFRLTREQLGNHSREGSSLSSSTVPLEDLKSDLQREIVMDNRLCSRQVDDVSVDRSRSILEKKCTEDIVQLANRINRNKSERDPEERENEVSVKGKIDLQPPIVSEILVKTLKFKQDLPIDLPKISEPVLPTKQFNFHNVLSDDYDKILAQDAMRLKESKVYVTKEEMEHQKLMDLLKKGDYDAVKSELERSYTLSTPGGSSPVCCPPCSPPPAPAAYISSARASSRRLGVGNALGGPPSPERDPLGRLLRFLKTFYRELGTRDPPHLPQWALPLPLGTLCPAHFQPHLQLVHKSEQEHLLENIKPEQIFAPVRLSDGTIAEAPRRVAVEGGPGSGRTTLCLRLLHQWATQGDGPALAFIVPLRELRGSPLLNYLARELFPRTAALGDAVAQVWRTLHLIEDRVLFVLDGYDECVGGRASLGDAIDLLEGRLFPDARILVTCSPNNSPTLSPLVQRRIHLAGLEWPHVERLCVAYFIHNDVAERACEFLEALNVQPQAVKQLGQHPLGWIMLCSLYQDSGSLPTETSALVQAAVKCIVKRSLDPPIPYNEEIPGHCRKRLEDFGKLSLAALREGRCCYTEAELRARGGGIEVTRLGFLTRGLTFGQRRKPDLYTPIHMAVAEFLAAYYLTSVAQYANILRRELEGLPPGIISHLAGLLGPKTHLILNQLCPLEVPPRAVFSLLKAAGASDGNISAVCRLVGAGPGFGPAPNERPPSPLVHTVPLELEGWARILKSPACTLEALELVFQIERGSDPRYLDEFFEALAGNESVKLVRITSLLGQESPTEEAQRLAGHLKSVLGKKKLNDFELVITCLEESAHDGLECVVNALCRGLSHASVHLARLVLDMNLSGKQVSRVCEALRDCVQVQALHLPHLSCGCEGLASVAELLKERPLLALNIAGCWGAKNEDPSSSGISMGSGSGSGSSGCASSTLGTLPLNRCCSSLPRGALAAYGSLTRPATLPRLPFGLGLGPGPVNGTGPLPVNDRDRDSNGSSKRNSDSVLCHRVPLLHPLPTCDASSHQGTGFHEIFNAIREPNCKLRSLNVSKCLVGGLDAECLGETIRKARNLDALRAAGASRPADVMPLVKALMEAPCLQLLDLASSRLALDDNPSRLLCHALVRNGTLRLLSLEGWTFRIEESDSLALFSELLRYTSVRELNLCNARLHLAVHEGPLARLGRRDDAGAELLRAAPPPACPVIVFLRLAGFQVTVNDRLALRGPLLLPFLAGFTALSELDLSLDKSAIGGSSDTLLFIDDKILQQFFGCLSSHFRNLQSLSINFWRISLEDSDKTMRQIAKYLKLCNLSFLRANGLNVTDSAKKVQMEHIFVQTLLTNLQYLTWLCLDGVDLTETQASSVGKCVRDRYPGTNLEISAKDVNVKSVKALVAAIEDGGRAEVLYTGGSNCRLKITKLQKNGRNKKK